jgi:hypothetical protein
MIPTAHKAKLPKSLSYPLGAEAISIALADAPHVGECKLYFYGRAAGPASRFNLLLQEGRPYCIFEVEYKPPTKPGLSAPNFMLDGEWYGAWWHLTVYPVKAELRHVAGTLLKEQGLPGVAAWLRSSEQAGWITRRHNLKLLFDPTAETLTVSRDDGV